MDPWMAEALVELVKERATIEADRSQLHEYVEKIRELLKESFHEETNLKLIAALRHLVDGQNSDVEEVCTDELRMARNKLNDIISLGSSTVLQNGKGEVNSDIIQMVALAHWGNYYYFLLRGDERNALIQVYECTQLDPFLGLSLFSQSLFSEDYETQLTNAQAELLKATTALELMSGENSKEQLVYDLKQTGLKIGAAAAGLVTGGLLGLLTFGPGAVGGAIAYKSIVQGNQGNIRKPKFHDTTELERKKTQFTELVKSILAALIHDCEARKTQLKKTTLSEMWKQSKLSRRKLKQLVSANYGAA